MAAVCVYCSSSDDIAPSYLVLAATVGRRIAAGGHTLVSGGGQVSMMGAVARAARAGGAHTVGVIPEHLLRYEVGDVDADEFHVVSTMRERKQLMDDKSDAFLVLPGGLGTLEEFFEVWTAMSLGMDSKPVIVLDADGFYDPLWRFLDDLGHRGFIRASSWESVQRVGTVEAAFELIESEARS
jgi:uncharacterized protein (TIGR00730 family)